MQFKFLHILMLVFFVFVSTQAYATQEQEEVKAKSLTSAPYAIFAALVKAEEATGSPKWIKWIARNDLQKDLLEIYTEARSDLKLFNNEEIKSIASSRAAEIRSFFKTHGFEKIQIRELAEQEFGIGSILNIQVQWSQPGQRIKLEIENKKYPGVLLEKRVKFYEVEGFSSPVVKLETLSQKDWVYMTIPEKAPRNVQELEEIVVNFYQSKKQEIQKYAGVKFPMVNLDQEEDISWLENMAIEDRPIWIAAALQQNKLKVNEKGAKAESGTALIIARGIPRYHVIDKPFLVWFERKGALSVVFAAYIIEEAWADPGQL